MSNQRKSNLWRNKETGSVRRSVWLLLALIILVGGGIFAYSRINFSGLPIPAGAHGVANFAVAERPVLVINAKNQQINVHVHSTNHVVTLRAVGYAGKEDNRAIPYTKTNNNERTTYTFDVSAFSSDTLDLAVPAQSDLQLTTSSDGITVNGISGKMFLSSTSGPITLNDTTLENGSSLNTGNGDLLLNNSKFKGGASLISDSGSITTTGVTFYGPATIRSNGDDVTLAQSTFAGTATLGTASGTLSITNTTISGVASIIVEGSGQLTTTDSTFNSTVTANVSSTKVAFTSTTFTKKVTVTGAGTFTANQSTFNADAAITARDAINVVATFNQKGNYQFATGHGDLDLTLAADQVFHVDAQAGYGSITSDFPGIQVTKGDDYNSFVAHGDFGKQPKLKFNLSTDYGAIRLHKA